MKELNFDTGLITYNLNGKCELTFNPTDGAFVERIFNAFDALDKKKEQYEAEVKNAKQHEIFDISHRRDNEMRALIDEVLEAPVCDAVFGNMNVYALANGLPVWCNLFFAIMDEMDTAFAREQKQTNPRIAKYTAKYHK